MLSYVSSILTLVRIFIMNECWISSKVFSASIEMVIWLLSFLLLMQNITLFHLHIVNVPHDPEINATWSWYMTFLCIARIVLRIFASVFCPVIFISLVIFFFSWCLVLLSRWWCYHRIILGEFSPLQYFQTLWEE